MFTFHQYRIPSYEDFRAERARGRKHRVGSLAELRVRGRYFLLLCSTYSKLRRDQSIPAESRTKAATALLQILRDFEAEKNALWFARETRLRRGSPPDWEFPKIGLPTP